MVNSINTNTNTNSYASMIAQQNRLSSSGGMPRPAAARATGNHFVATQGIAERMGIQRNADQSKRDISDGISAVQAAGDGLSKIKSNLERMRELASYSTSPGDGTDRQAMQKEFADLQSEIDQFVKAADFNGQNLLNGSTSKFKIDKDGRDIVGRLTDVRANSLGNYQVTSSNSMGQARGGASLEDISRATAPREALAITAFGEQRTVKLEQGASAGGVAEAVNAAGAGVSAQARTQLTMGFSGSGSVSFSLRANEGSSVEVRGELGSSAEGGGIEGVAMSVNELSWRTGIRASVADGGKLKLESLDGDDIAIDNFKTGGGASATVQGMNAFTGEKAGDEVTLGGGGSQAVRVGGTVQFSSVQAFSVQSDASGGISDASSTRQTDSVASIGIADERSSGTALSVLGVAISQVSSFQENLKDLNSQLVSVGTSSSKNSRVRDADAALQTAVLTREQMVQQAGVAMLAQANTQPSQALSLLR